MTNKEGPILYEVLGEFLSSVRKYLATKLNPLFPNGWESEVTKSLRNFSGKQSNWEKTWINRKNKTAVELIDFTQLEHIAKYFKSTLFTDNQGNYNPNVSNWLGELNEFRNDIAHYNQYGTEPLTDNKIAKSWIHMEEIATIIGDKNLLIKLSDLKKESLEEKLKFQEEEWKKKYEEEFKEKQRIWEEKAKKDVETKLDDWRKMEAILQIEREEAFKIKMDDERKLKEAEWKDKFEKNNVINDKEQHNDVTFNTLPILTTEEYNEKKKQWALETQKELENKEKEWKESENKAYEIREINLKKQLNEEVAFKEKEWEKKLNEEKVAQQKHWEDIIEKERVKIEEEWKIKLDERVRQIEKEWKIKEVKLTKEIVEKNESPLIKKRIWKKIAVFSFVVLILGTIIYSFYPNANLPIPETLTPKEQSFVNSLKNLKHKSELIQFLEIETRENRLQYVDSNYSLVENDSICFVVAVDNTTYNINGILSKGSNIRHDYLTNQDIEDYKLNYNNSTYLWISVH